MKVNILGCQVNKLDMQGVIEQVERFIDAAAPHHIITLNAEIIYQAQSQPELLRLINQADFVTPDGSGVVWAARYLGTPVPERVTGIDLTLKLAEVGAQKGWGFYLYGAAPGIAQAAAASLKTRHKGLRILGTAHGYLSEAEQEPLLEDIKTKKPDILLVALGAPRQEFWIAKYLKELSVPVVMGIGGSLDVISGKAKRAPVAYQKAGLEWLYRLLKEPHRLGRMMSLPKFTIMVRLKGKKQAR